MLTLEIPTVRTVIPEITAQQAALQATPVDDAGNNLYMGVDQLSLNARAKSSGLEECGGVKADKAVFPAFPQNCCPVRSIATVREDSPFQVAARIMNFAAQRPLAEILIFVPWLFLLLLLMK